MNLIAPDTLRFRRDTMFEAAALDLLLQQVQEMQLK